MASSWRLTSFEPDEAHTVLEFVVEAIKLEEEVRACLLRHGVAVAPRTFGRAVDQLRPVWVQYGASEADWRRLREIVEIRNLVVHRAPASGYYTDVDDEDSYTAVWEVDSERTIGVDDIDKAGDDAWELATVVRGLRPA